jgi:hypothetical protein
MITNCLLGINVLAGITVGTFIFMDNRYNRGRSNGLAWFLAGVPYFLGLSNLVFLIFNF